MAKDDIQADFPVRAKAAKRKAATALRLNRGAKGGRMSKKERAGHTKAISAADRVLKRTGSQVSKPSKPDKPKRKDLFAGLKALFGLSQLPDKEKKALEGIEKKTRK